MKCTSEYVSLGHPDKIADYISSYLLDRYLAHDPYTRYAVEVQIKDEIVTLGGEVTSSYVMTNDEICRLVRDAVADIGYDVSYFEKWGPKNTISAANLVVNVHLSQQSPDIARGVDSHGWGDQGIYWGMATTDFVHENRALDHWSAEAICKLLYGEALNDGEWGIDIKTQVEVTDGKITKVVVAAPCLTDAAQDNLTEYVRRLLETRTFDMAPDYELIVNGTGRFVVHGPIGDCGTTGRKLVVDFYGGACRIGGGSPWTKDGTKADVALNLYARKIALANVHRVKDVIYVQIASAIGRKEISVVLLDGANHELASWTESRDADEIVAELELRKPTYGLRCESGLFFDIH